MKYLLISLFIALFILSCGDDEESLQQETRVVVDKQDQLMDSVLNLDYEHILLAYSPSDCSHNYSTLFELKEQSMYPVIFVFREKQMRRKEMALLASNYSADYIASDTLYKYIQEKSEAHPMETGIIHVMSKEIMHESSLMFYVFPEKIHRHDTIKHDEGF